MIKPIHEFHLVSRNDHGSSSRMVPYCTCGWVGVSCFTQMEASLLYAAHWDEVR